MDAIEENLKIQLRRFLEDVEQQPSDTRRFELSKKKGAHKLVAASELPDLYLRASDNDVTAFPNQDDG